MCPLHKQISINNRDNFTRISLLSVFSKVVFIKILQDRFTKLVVKRLSILDNVSNLQSVIQKYLAKKKGRYYVLYVDLNLKSCVKTQGLTGNFTRNIDRARNNVIPPDLSWLKYAGIARYIIN